MGKERFYFKVFSDRCSAHFLTSNSCALRKSRRACKKHYCPRIEDFNRKAKEFLEYKKRNPISKAMREYWKRKKRVEAALCNV